MVVACFGGVFVQRNVGRGAKSKAKIGAGRGSVCLFGHWLWDGGFAVLFELFSSKGKAALFFQSSASKALMVGLGADGRGGFFPWKLFASDPLHPGPVRYFVSGDQRRTVCSHGFGFLCAFSGEAGSAQALLDCGGRFGHSDHIILIEFFAIAKMKIK